MSEHASQAGGSLPDVSLTRPGVPPPVPTAPFRPVGERERILALDVLRGFALLGILMVNMQFFAMPFLHVMFDPALADGPVADKLAAAFVKAFCEYKFISLFSLLFGIGFVVQLTKAQARAQSEKAIMPMYIRRLLVLLGFGVVHAFGLWYGDILIVYAVMGFALLLFGFYRPRTLLTLAAIFLAVGIVLSLCSGGTQVAMAAQAGEQIEAEFAEAEAAVEAGEAPTGWDAIVLGQFNPMHPYWVHGETVAFRDGPVGDAMLYRAIMYGYMVMAGLFSYLWHVLAMFLLGAALMKLDFFASSKRHWHRRLALIALPVGLVMELANASQVWAGAQGFTWTTVLLMPVREVGSVTLCMGYVGLWCVIVERGWLRWVTTALANVGRMALTNYLMQTVLATFITYHWGLGFFGEVARPQQIGLVLAIFAGQIVFSALWLKVFRMGPLEWLWRTLTYLRPPTMLRSSTPPAA